MTMTHEAAVRPSVLPDAPAAIFAVLGLIDLALTAVIGSADAPPLFVSLGAGTLGLITLLCLVPARRGSRPALVAIVVTRVISAVVFAAPAFFLGAPAWVLAVTGFIVAGTIVALVLLWQQGRRPVLSGLLSARGAGRIRPARAPGTGEGVERRRGPDPIRYRRAVRPDAGRGVTPKRNRASVTTTPAMPYFRSA